MEIAIELIKEVIGEGCDDLSDGFVLWKFLCAVEPEYFNDGNGVKPSNNNYDVAMTNVARILAAASEFYAQRLGTQFDIKAVDARKVCKDKNEGEILMLVQICIGIGVKCSGSATLIQAILRLPESSQVWLKDLIEKDTYAAYLFNDDDDEGDDDGDDDDGDDKRKTKDDDDDFNGAFAGGGGNDIVTSNNSNSRSWEEEKENLLRAVTQAKEDSQNFQRLLLEAENSNHVLRAEAQALKSENAALATQVETQKRLVQELRAEVRAVKSDSVRVEEGEMLRLQVAEQSSHIGDLERKLQEASGWRAENRRLQDELDAAKAAADKSKELESQVERLRKRAEEGRALKARNDALQQEIDMLKSSGETGAGGGGKRDEGGDAELVNSFKQQLAQAMKECKTLVQQREERDSRIKELTEELANLNTKVMVGIGSEKALEKVALLEQFRADAENAEREGCEEGEKQPQSLSDSLHDEANASVQALRRENERLRQQLARAVAMAAESAAPAPAPTAVASGEASAQVAALTAANESLRRAIVDGKEQWKREERVLLTCFYDVAYDFHKLKAAEEQRYNSDRVSWLAKKRVVVNMK